MPGVLREGDQQRLVAGEMIEHAGEEVRVARGLADLLRADAGDGEEAAELLGLRGEERQRRDGERLGCLAPRAALAAADLAALHGANPRDRKLACCVATCGSFSNPALAGRG